MVLTDFEKIKVGIISLTVGHWDLMTDHMNAIYDTYPYPKEFYIIPNMRFEMSLSAAINKGFQRAEKDKCDVIVYCADDVVPGAGAIETLVDYITQHDIWIVHGTGANSSGWDMFALVPEIFRNVGYWDEAFYPAYFEDNDFARRVTMRDASKYAYIPLDFFHKKSQTIARMSEKQLADHHKNFQKNQERYIAKWGGEPGKETYQFPYDTDYSQFPDF